MRSKKWPIFFENCQNEETRKKLLDLRAEILRNWRPNPDPKFLIEKRVQLYPREVDQKMLAKSNFPEVDDIERGRRPSTLSFPEGKLILIFHKSSYIIIYYIHIEKYSLIFFYSLFSGEIKIVFSLLASCVNQSDCSYDFS